MSPTSTSKPLNSHLRDDKMKKRRKSIKNELIYKAKEAMLAAVQIYNNPTITFKAESFITLAVIAWTYLLHAYYRQEKIDYRYFEEKGERKRYDKTKHGAFKHWELERCLNEKHCPLDVDTTTNLKFLIGIRHEIEHQMTNQIDELISAKLQACAINFDYYIINLFGDKYGLNKDLSLVIQFSPLTVNQQKDLRNNRFMLSSVRNFIVDFEDSLSENVLTSSKYAYRVLFTPVNAKRKGQADQVIEFIDSKSPLANEVEKTYTIMKETEKPKYRPSEIVKMMQEEGDTWCSISKHTDLWKAKDAKNAIHGYGTSISGTWYWYDSWVEVVRQNCFNQKKNYSNS